LINLRHQYLLFIRLYISFLFTWILQMGIILVFILILNPTIDLDSMQVHTVSYIVVMSISLVVISVRIYQEHSWSMDQLIMLMKSRPKTSSPAIPFSVYSRRMIRNVSLGEIIQFTGLFFMIYKIIATSLITRSDIILYFSSLLLSLGIKSFSFPKKHELKKLLVAFNRRAQS